MARPNERSIGRAAINYLKARYEGGAVFAGAAEIRAVLIVALGVKPAKVTPTRASDWDRQARYELAHGLVFVTQPVAALDYRRDPSAPPEEREGSQGVRHGELVKRIANQRLIADAGAAQVDATPVEIRNAERLRIVQMIAEQIETGTS